MTGKFEEGPKKEQRVEMTTEVIGKFRLESRPMGWSIVDSETGKTVAEKLGHTEARRYCRDWEAESDEQPKTS